MSNVSEGTFHVERRDTSKKDTVSKGTCILETSLLY